MKKYNYFDDNKSLVENVYYLLMILSLVFVAIQIIIARDSMDHNAQMQLTQHTIEQDNRYRLAIEDKAEKFMNALLESPYPVDGLKLDTLMMQPDNLEEMTPDELMRIMPFNDSIMADIVELERLVQIQLDLATELEQYAFFVLNGFIFEELAYRDLGNTFLRSMNLAAMPVIYMMSYRNYIHHHITESHNVRGLYRLWWLRQQIDIRRNRIDICRSILEGDEHEMGFLRVAEAEELSLGPDELRATMKRMESELADLEKRLASKLKQVSVRNI